MTELTKLRMTAAVVNMKTVLFHGNCKLMIESHMCQAATAHQKYKVAIKAKSKRKMDISAFSQRKRVRNV